MQSATDIKDWGRLTDTEQVELTRGALQVALHTVADQIALLAGEMELGSLPDHGGPDALRLLASILRLSGPEGPRDLFRPAGLDLATMEVAGRA